MADQPSTGSFTTVTNSHLLRGLADANNRTVWQEFVHRYRPVIFRFASRLGLRGHDAEDAAQKTLVAFFRGYRAGAYDPAKGRLRAWLFGIAFRQIKNVIRDINKGRVKLANGPDRTAFIEGLPDNDKWEDLFEEEWRRAVVRQCLIELAQRFKPTTIEAFKLHGLQGLSAKEAADRLGISEDAVYSAKYKVSKEIKRMRVQMEAIF